MKHALVVARMQAVNWTLLVATPLAVVVGAFLLNWVIVAAVGGPGDSATGAIASVYFGAASAYSVAVTQFFPFAVGLSLTRRAFYAGTLLVATVQAVALGLLLSVLERIEQASGGWGIGLRFFGVAFLRQGSFLAQWATYTVPFLVLAALFLAAGVIFKRWGQPALYAAGLAFATLGTAVALLVVWRGWGPAIATFFTTTPTLALLAGYPLILVVVVGGLGWLALRRATP